MLLSQFMVALVVLSINSYHGASSVAVGFDILVSLSTLLSVGGLCFKPPLLASTANVG
jgi:hypothetical protein